MNNREVIHRLLLMYQHCEPYGDCVGIGCEKCKEAVDTIIEILNNERQEGNMLGNECHNVLNAVDTIMGFLGKHEKYSTTSFWESDIDGQRLSTDWGYFDDGMRELKLYCERLNNTIESQNDEIKSEVEQI